MIRLLFTSIKRESNARTEEQKKTVMDVNSNLIINMFY